MHRAGDPQNAEIPECTELMTLKMRRYPISIQFMLAAAGVFGAGPPQPAVMAWSYFASMKPLHQMPAQPSGAVLGSGRSRCTERVTRPSASTSIKQMPAYSCSRQKSCTLHERLHQCCLHTTQR